MITRPGMAQEQQVTGRDERAGGNHPHRRPVGALEMSSQGENEAGYRDGAELAEWCDTHAAARDYSSPPSDASSRVLVPLMFSRVVGARHSTMVGRRNR